MPAFKTEVPHALGKEEATQRLKDFLDRIAEHYKDQISHLEGEWDDNVLTFSLTTYGFTITGKLTVEEDGARVEGQLPLAAVAFRGRIEQSIADELRQELERPA